MKNLLFLVTLISEDNAIPMKPLQKIEFPDGFGYDWKKLDEQAATLSLKDADIFCRGEEFEMNKLVAKTGFDQLHNCLNEIFDGCLSKYFWAV